MSRSSTLDWVRTAADKRAVELGCYFDSAAADRVREFFARYLRHSKGQFANQSFELLDWQWQGVVAPLFGWMRPDGTRRFNKGYIEVPKKNGKSTLGAGLSLYMLIGDREPGAQVFNAAVDRSQARIVFSEAANMVVASPDLTKRLKVRKTSSRIEYPQQNAHYQALSADVHTKEGLNWHFLLFDELHAQKTRDMFDTLTYGGASRRQPLFLSITTAGYDRESVCYEQHLYAAAILDGSNDDPSFFAYLAAAAEDDDWKSPETWKKANPSYGVTIPARDFEERCQEAQRQPSLENAFRRYRLNQWTEQDVRAIPMDDWAACQGAVEPAEQAECWGGLDLASTQDVTAFVLWFADNSILPFFWVPEEAAKERERRNKRRFDQWIRQGFMQVTTGNSTDYAAIRRKINELRRRFLISEIAFDPWNARQLATQLGEEDGFTMVETHGGFGRMSEPTKLLLGYIKDHSLRHGNHPVLTWMAGNVTAEENGAGDIRFSRKKSTEKIDGVIATVLALSRAMLRLSGSIYETQGIAFV